MSDEDRAKSVDDILDSGRAEKAGEQRVAADHGVAPSDQASGDDRSSDREQKTVPLGTYVEQRRRAKEDRERASAAEERVAQIEEENRALRAAEENRQLRAAEQERAREQAENSGQDFWSNPEAHLQNIQRDANLRASRAEIVAEYGRATLDAVEQAVGEAMARNDPEVLALRDDMIRHGGDAQVALAWYQRRQGNIPARRAAALQPMPSNLASARSVGARSGPAWSGPASLGDIFKR